MLRAACVLLFLGVAACGDSRAVRLTAGRSDTLIVNGRGSVPLSVRLVDGNGVERKAKRVRYQLIAGDVEITDDRVACDGRDDAVVAATAGGLTTRVTVLCRPVAGFRMPRVLRLTIGGPPAPLDVGARDVEGKPVDAIAGKVSVRDSQVVAIVDGLIHARGLGTTAVEVEAGDCAVSIPVEVIGSSLTSEGLRPNEEYIEAVTVSAGELRSWRVPPGRYEISLFDDRGAPAHLRIASHEMNCAALPLTEQRYSCIANDRASVVVHHTQAAGRGRQSSATLVVHRRADLSSESKTWRPRLYVYPCPYVAR